MHALAVLAQGALRRLEDPHHGQARAPVRRRGLATRDAVEEGGVEALLEKTRRVPNLKNRTDPETEDAVVAYAIEYPDHGQVRVSNELRKQGVFVSPSGVRSIWLRHTLQSRKLRLKALEAKVAKEGIVLTEAQVAALERHRSTDEAHRGNIRWL